MAAASDVVECVAGSIPRQTQRLLLKLAEASEELSAEAFLRHASAVVSVALQCGNADIAARGTQSLRMRQAMLALRTVALYGGWHHRGASRSHAAS